MAKEEKKKEETKPLTAEEYQAQRAKERSGNTK